MFRELLRRLPDLQLADDGRCRTAPSNFITGPESMPVVFTPQPRLTPA